MCSKLEDCLLTRIGFRIFLITIISIILAAIAFNVSFKFLDTDAGHVDRHAAHVSRTGSHNVLLWTPLHGSWSTWWTPAYLGDSDQMTRLSETSSRCHHLSSCSFTTDRSSLNLSSLVVFSYSDINLLDMPPKYLLGQKWALFLPTPTQRHSSSSTWSHYLPMFHLLISYFPQSSVPMNQAKVVSYSSIGPINDSSISGISDVKFRKV